MTTKTLCGRDKLNSRTRMYVLISAIGTLCESRLWRAGCMRVCVCALKFRSGHGNWHCVRRGGLKKRFAIVQMTALR